MTGPEQWDRANAVQYLFRRALVLIFATVFMSGATAQTESQDSMAHHDHSQHNMSLDAAGMVMGSNDSTLPRDCDEIGPDVRFTVEAGTEFASDNPGTTFGYSQHHFEVPPCSRVTVTFINNDQVRHQWMVHGLPKYLYAAGMFHLEAAGGERKTGTFIVPSDHRTYLVHCDVAQHMEKGMKGQLKVGRGSGDLWAVPGVSANFNADSYLPGKPALLVLGLALVLFVGLVVWLVVWRRL